MARSAHVHLTPEQENARRVIEGYAHLAVWLTFAIILVGVLYVATLYLLSLR